MEQYVIKGGNPLNGEVEIGGAKNAALAILAASIMTDETVTIENLPNVRDINVLLQAIEEIGAKVERINAHKVKINGSFIRDVNVDNAFIRRIRASYYLIGALLGKYKKAQVALRYWKPSDRSAYEGIPCDGSERGYRTRTCCCRGRKIKRNTYLFR